MRTVTATVYTYDELSDKAKERARRHANDNNWYTGGWDGEWRATLAKVQEDFGFKATDWCAGPFARVHVRTDMEPETGMLQGDKAVEYIRDRVSGDLADCPWTGTFTDGAFADTLADFMAEPDDMRNLATVLYDATLALLQAWCDEEENATTDEYLAEQLSDSDHEWTKEGVYYDDHIEG